MHPLFHAFPPIDLRLTKDLTRYIKRGHAWLFTHAIDGVAAPSGTVVTVWDRRGEKRLATGIYDPQHPIAVRICKTTPPWDLDHAWLSGRLRQALQLRRSCLGPDTTGYRLIAGEGDSLPGLIIDVYDRTAVLKLDGGAPEAFYDVQGLAQWLHTEAEIETVVLRERGRGASGQTVLGSPPEERVSFLENGLQFSADVLRGQKTGFFLDQRDNRHIVRNISLGKRVLNLFSFSGGFSIAAGMGGANQVVSVDSARPAIEDAEHHWRVNSLPADKHQGVVADCFEYLDSAVRSSTTWDIVICDPPSFAPNEKSRPQALRAYAKLAQLSAQATSPGGLLALASCSSHIDEQAFVEINAEALGRARRRATLLAKRGLPLDHPTPLAMPELRYLKFLLFRLD